MTGKTFVLVHGAWHGGWCWRRVADRLRAAGHAVFTPTCTGLGERAHLLSRSIDLETFTQDVVGVVEAEELSDVILVGHSFGGAPITGAANRIPSKIRHLVYLDALILQDGESPFSRLPPDVAEARRKAARETSGGVSVPAPPPSAFAVTEPADVEWLTRRLTPHPLGAFEGALRLNNHAGIDLPRTYIACVEPIYEPLEASRARVKRQPGWNRLEIAAGHDAMVTAPDELARLLQSVA